MNVFELQAKISVDSSEYEAGIRTAKSKFKTFVSNVGTAVKNVAKVTAAVTAATATGVGVIGKLAVESYASYEQLVGGVETLFGKSSERVKTYAQEAYQTAGMSANKYMEAVTSFSASLLQGLGGDTEAASQIANRAITDMADNANKMGSTMESIQNAYAGFAKQNYTMLDNLKLGYGGTASEMQRLIKEASEMTAAQEALGLSVDASSLSFSNIVDAISVVQYEMGITGTTALEASKTISGSISSMKAAWENFLTGMGDPSQDFASLANQLVESVKTVGDNIVPRIKEIGPKIVEGFASLTSGMLPYISDTVMSLLPTVVDGVSGVVNSAVSILPDILNTALNVLPSLVSAAGKVMNNLKNAFVEKMPMLVSTGKKIIANLTTGITENVPAMVKKLPEVIEAFLNFISSNLPNILDSGVKMLNSITTGIIGAIPTLVDNLPKILETFVNFIGNNLPKIVAAGISILRNLVSGIIGAIPELSASVPELIATIVLAIGELAWDLMEAGGQIVQSIMNGISAAWTGLVNWFNGLWNDVFSDRTANITVNKNVTTHYSTSGTAHGGTGGGFDGSHAGGLDYVPYDGYVAQLHKGEKVLTAAEAKQAQSSKTVSPIFNVTVNGAKYDDLGELARDIMQAMQHEYDKEALALC